MQLRNLNWQMQFFFKRLKNDFYHCLFNNNIRTTLKKFTKHLKFSVNNYEAFLPCAPFSIFVNLNCKWCVKVAIMCFLQHYHNILSWLDNNNKMNKKFQKSIYAANEFSACLSGVQCCWPNSHFVSFHALHFWPDSTDKKNSTSRRQKRRKKERKKG